MNADQRVVITGMGIVSPLGIGVTAYHQSLSQGRDGISALSFPWETGYMVNRAGLVKDFIPSEVAGDDQCPRTTQLAIAACRMALKEAGFEGHRLLAKTGVIVGTAMGEALAQENIWRAEKQQHRLSQNNHNIPPMLPNHLINGRIAAHLGLEGPSYLLTTTCASGNHAIAWASRLLKSGAADAMLAVGADTLSYVDILGVSRLLLQAPDRCRPFDLNRKGLVFSEGAGALLLEPLHRAKRRGAQILAEVAGHGLSCDAAGAFSGKVNQVGSLLKAAKEALREAKREPANIQYISAHVYTTK